MNKTTACENRVIEINLDHLETGHLSCADCPRMPEIMECVLNFTGFYITKIILKS